MTACNVSEAIRGWFVKTELYRYNI